MLKGRWRESPGEALFRFKREPGDTDIPFMMLVPTLTRIWVIVLSCAVLALPLPSRSAHAEEGAEPVLTDAEVDANLADAEMAEDMDTMRKYFDPGKNQGKDVSPEAPEVVPPSVNSGVESDDDGQALIANLIDTISPTRATGPSEVCPFHPAVVQDRSVAGKADGSNGSGTSSANGPAGEAK